MSQNMPRVMTATTSFGNNTSQKEIADQQKDQVHNTSGWTLGTIKDVHDTKPMVKVTDLFSGTKMFGDEFIPLAHSVEDIATRFGTVRTDMGVIVFFVGHPGAASLAFAMIIGNEGELGPIEAMLENDAEQSMHTIFMEPM